MVEGKPNTESITDLGAKTVFRNMRLVTELFRNFTEEFKDMENEVIERYIETDSEGLPLEFKDELYDMNTDLVRLDTLLEARVPGREDEHVRIRFNIETQAYVSSRYGLTDRAQMYAAMLLATQNKEKKGKDKYRGLKRSYTVWICPKAPESLVGCKVRYGMLPYDTSPKEIGFGSLMDIIMIYIGRPRTDDERSVTDMLSLIFSDDGDTVKRQEVLEHKYNISLDLQSLRRVNLMTDWISEAKEEFYEDGYAAGEAAGIAKGKIEKSAEDIVRIMSEFGCTLEKALEVTKVSDEDREEVLELVKKYQN